MTSQATNPTLRLGYSRPLYASLGQVSADLISNGIVTTQFYPTTELPIALVAPTELETVRNLMSQHQFSFKVHCPHTVNLAKRPIKALNNLASQIGALPGAIVVHLGQVDKAVPGQAATPADLARGRNQVCANLNEPSLVRTCPILLENAAGEGTLTRSKSFEYGRSLEEIRLVYEGLDQTNGIGFCLDTQHSYAAGLCHWAEPDQILIFLDDLESCGAKIQTIHLNGSYKTFGSRVDRHAPICYQGLVKGKAVRDYIWARDSTRGLRALLERAVESNWDVISETPHPKHDFGIIAGLWAD